MCSVMVSYPLTSLLATSCLIWSSLAVVEGTTAARNNGFRVTSAWKKKPSTSSCQCYFSKSCHNNHVRVGGSAFLPPSPVRRKAEVVSRNEDNSGSTPSNRKLTFLSQLLVHQSSTNTNSPSRRRCHAQRMMHPYGMHSVQRRNSFALFVSKDAGDDECSLQRLYQQVQEEDSEWYKETFSKLFDDDEDPSALIPPCTSEILNAAKEDTDDDGNSGGGQIETKSSTIEQSAAVAGGSEETVEGNQQEQPDWKEAMEGIRMRNEKLLKKANEQIHSSEEKEVVVDSPPRSVRGEIGEEDSQMESPESSQKQGVKEDEVEEEEEERLWNETPLPHPSAADSFNHEFEGDEDNKDIHRHSRDVERKYYIDDDEYEDLDEYDDVHNYNSSESNRRSAPRMRRPTPEPEREVRQQRQKSEPLSSAGTSTPAPKAVVLRNTQTEESITLSPLSALAKLGYSQNELVVIKPQVLELIVEDGIRRPSKGLPKIWVRLSRLDSYVGEEEEEDEADVNWNVEVVALQKIEEAAFEEEEAMVEEEIGQVKEDFSEHAAEVSEPRGPFTSLRVANGRKSEVRDGDDYDDIHKYERTSMKGGGAGKQRSRQQQQQQPIGATSDNISYNSKYDSERGESSDYDARRIAARPPTGSQSRRQQRRRDYDEYDDFGRRPRGDTPQRPRRRQRPLAARERNLRIDRGSYNSPPPNKFWMDLPTFQSFLRKEAQFRLKILGPDWKESVLDESRWRYDLYKTWLTMLDEGVGGENPLYEYGDRPRKPRQRRMGQPPPPRSGGGKRDGYDKSPPGPNRQQQLRRPENELGEDDESYPQRRTRPDATPPRGEDSERSSRRRERELRSDSFARDHWSSQLPRRGRGDSGSTWKNFSDLEESLVQRSFSPTDRTRLERGKYYPPDRRSGRRRRGVANGDEEEDAPIGTKMRVKEDMPIEEEFNHIKEGPPPGGRSRKGLTTMTATRSGSTSLSGSCGSQHRDDYYGRGKHSEERMGNDASPRRRRKDDCISD